MSTYSQTQNVFRIAVLSGLALAALFFVSSCQDSQGSEQRPLSAAADDPVRTDEPFRNELSSFDFLPAIQSTESIEFGEDPNSLAEGVQPTAEWLNAQQSNGTVPDRNLSTTEAQLLGAYVFEDQEQISGFSSYAAPKISRLPMLLSGQLQKTGRLPANGMEILEAQGWLTEEGQKSWQEMNDTKRLELFRSVVHPATGRLYESFSQSEWTPFGVNAVVPARKDWASLGIDPQNTVVHTITNNEVDQDMKRAVEGVLHVTVYGEEPGSILLERVITW